MESATERRVAIFQSFPRRPKPMRVDHFGNTVLTQVPIELLRQGLTDDEWDSIVLRGSARVPVWGFRNEGDVGQVFARIREGDLIFFYDKELVWAAARVVLRFTNKSVADGLVQRGSWETYEGKTYPLLLVLEGVRADLKIPPHELKSALPRLGRGRPPRFLDISLPEWRALQQLADQSPSALDNTANHAVGTDTRSPMNILIIADEWASGRGGISTFNRGLCLALARKGAHVECLIGNDPSVSEVMLSALRAAALPGRLDITKIHVDQRIIDHPQALAVQLEAAEAKALSSVDVVIGHGHITGSAARTIQGARYPTARLVHIVHTDHEQVSAARSVSGVVGGVRRAAEKLKLESANCGQADVLCGVGPNLQYSAQKILNAIDEGSRKIRDYNEVVEILPGYGGEVANKVPPGLQILTIGRLDDPAKGLDVFKKVIERLPNDLGRFEWIIRGVPDEQADEQQRQAMQIHLGAIVRSYSSSEAALAADYRNATVVCMASRQEGFGLVAFEAAMRAIPVLVQTDSGFGNLLARLDDTDRALVEPDTNEDVLVSNWLKALTRVLRDPAKAYAEARARLDQLRSPEAGCDWELSARKILAQAAFRSNR